MEKSIEVSNGYINGTFINVYTAENPLLNEGDQCYFLFTSIDNTHRPIIGKGVVESDYFTDGLNKNYFIQLEEICEKPDVSKQWVWRRQYFLYPPKDMVKRVSKVMNIAEYTTDAFLSKNLFKIEAFFVRKTYKDIFQLRKDYLAVILEETEKNIEDMQEILNQEM